MAAATTATATGKNYYELLGVSRTADNEAIKRAFRTLAKTNHPDKGGSEERFKELSKAANVLQDPVLRASYDARGEAGVNETQQHQKQQQHHQQQQEMATVRVAASVGGPKKVVVPVSVTLEEICSGVVKSASFEWDKPCGACHQTGCKTGKHSKRCRDCDGKGLLIRVRPIGPGIMQQSAHPCAACHGQGRYICKHDRCPTCHGATVTRANEQVAVQVPKGVHHRQQIRPVVPNDALETHVLFVVDEQQHARFERHGHHLVTKHTVPLVDALTGIQITLVGVDGEALNCRNANPGESNNAAVTKPGSLFRLAQHGLPRRLNTAERGDLFVQIDVEFPTALSPQIQHILKRCLPSPAAAAATPPPPLLPSAIAALDQKSQPPPPPPSTTPTSASAPASARGGTAVELEALEREKVAELIQAATQESPAPPHFHPLHHPHAHRHEQQCRAQ